ncbi:MAG: flippase-like domain-containing protein [Clostridia bacterium]|nr:flippase-like domain-containing protein [Clostridia bacterium]
MKISKKRIFNTLFVIIVFLITVWTVFKDEDLGQVFEYISSSDIRYIIPAVFCVIFFILGEAVNIYYLLRRLGTKVSFWHCSLYSFIGFFYSCITPSASGGQPLQMIAMRKDKIPLAVSTIVLAIVTITYKFVLVLIGAVILIFRPDSLMVYIEPCEELIYIGMGLNVIVITLLLLAVFFPHIIRSLATGIMKGINRIRPFKNPKKQYDRLERILGQYEGTSDFFRHHIGVIFNVFVITLLQRFILFTVTWFTYLSFNMHGTSFTVVTCLQAMISVASDMMPTPGGMGVSENMFIAIFQPVFTEPLVVPAMVISRGISYYTQLFISAVMTFLSSFIIKEKSTDTSVKGELNE